MSASVSDEAMRVLSAEEMGEADRSSVYAGVSIATLMQNAGTAVARFCLRHCTRGQVVALCGKGNNGGDGMVAARVLAENGWPVRVVLLGQAQELKNDAAAAWQALVSQSDVERREVEDEAGLRAALEGAELVLDAVVGTGFKPPLRGLAATARDVLSGMTVRLVAVDLPSGWNADSIAQSARGEDGRDLAFRADAVVTFTAPKLAHVFGHLTAPQVFGPVVVAPIGTPEDAVRSATGLSWTGSAKKTAEKPRDINGNKGKFGHVLIIGGALGKAGAPSMASLSALRAGAGLVTAAVPRAIASTVAGVAPELMLQPVQQDERFGVELLEPDVLEKLLKGMTVVGIGPGLGTDGATPDFVRGFVERCTLPMVIDADALNALAGHTDVLKAASAQKDANGKGRVLVLTPHPGEMARLIGGKVPDVEADRLGVARQFATEHGVTLVLKGWRTLVAHPDRRIAVNTTGNPAMAKGGSGDILTGIVAAMLGQYKDDVAGAVEAAVFLHGLAGDFACLAQDEHTMLATDTVAHLWQAFRARVADEDGLTWITGLAARVVERGSDGEYRRRFDEGMDTRKAAAHAQHRRNAGAR